MEARVLKWFGGRKAPSKAKKQEQKETVNMEKEIKKEVISAMNEMKLQDIRCGFGSWTPEWLQVFARTGVYLVVYCVSGLILGMNFTYTVSTISTIEKRFKLTSKNTGVMLAGNDISQVLFSILLSYFGSHGNRPKWLGIGIISASLACFLSAAPHFVYGPGQDALTVATSLSQTPSNISANSHTNKADLCHLPYVEECKTSSADSYYSSLGPVSFFFFGQFFVGLTISTFYSLGFVYLDDNVNKEEFPVYYALSMVIRVVGPVAGFFLGSKCLGLYIDPRYSPNISLKDPRWLGAWWLGFLVLGTVLLFCGGIVLLFPRTLPVTMLKKVTKVHKENFSGDNRLTKDSDLDRLVELARKPPGFKKPTLKDLPAGIKKLFQNKIWAGHNFNTVFTLLGIVGYWNFNPKYLEFQFRKSASTANFYTGVASLISSIVGLSVSGFFIKALRPSARALSGYNCIMTVFSACTMFSLIFIGCPQLEVVGPQYRYENSAVGSCVENCGCSQRYSPVCSDDGITTFYSPCYAGCTSVNTSTTPYEYINCKCLSSVALVGTLANETGTSSIYEVGGAPPTKTIHGYCSGTCNSFVYYIIILIITKTIESTGVVGTTLVFLRSVEEHEKGLALGVSIVIFSLFAFIPGPIIMGAIVDSACIIWDQSCGQRGSCWLYDSDKFRLIIHIFPAVLILFSLMGDIMVFRNSRHLILYTEKDSAGHGKDAGHENPAFVESLSPHAKNSDPALTQVTLQ